MGSSGRMLRSHLQQQTDRSTHRQTPHTKKLSTITDYNMIVIPIADLIVQFMDHAIVPFFTLRVHLFMLLIFKQAHRKMHLEITKQARCTNVNKFERKITRVWKESFGTRSAHTFILPPLAWS